MHNQFLLGIRGGQQGSDQILWLIAETIRQQVASDGLMVIGAKFVMRVADSAGHVGEPTMTTATC